MRAVAHAAEELRQEWVDERLVQAGRIRSQSLGWPDVYTFTKALGERVAEDLWGAEHRLSIVRPTIIESSAAHPYPGWIDGFKVADPLIAAYGRGMLPEFPALADTILDVIPVDHVVNAILAVAANPPEVNEPRYYQVASGIRNPLRFGQLLRIVRGYFSANPLRDDEGSLIQVPNWSFPNRPRVERSLRLREAGIDVADRASVTCRRTRPPQMALDDREPNVTSARCANSPTCTSPTPRPKWCSTTRTPARSTSPSPRTSVPSTASTSP